jgi:hypothetical protein
MSASINSYIKLKEIVYGYSEAAKQSESEFLRLWRLCFTGFKQMGLNAFWQPKTQILTVEPQKVAYWPDDCIQWIKIGQFNWQGELQTLRVNEQLTTFHADMDNRLSDITPEIQDCEGVLQSQYWFDGQGFWYGPYSSQERPFGLHSRMIQYGECVVDVTKRMIILNTDYQYPQVVMEYVSAPEMDGDYAIPLQFEMATRTFLAWQDIAYLPATSHINNNTVMMRGRMFKAQLRLAKKMYKPVRMQELYQVAIESQMMSLKP